MQANWTDPLLFFISSIARPLGGALILVFMFTVVASGRRGPMLDCFLVGAALWPYVVWTMQGLGWAVLEEREHFKMIRYVYTAPIPSWAFLVGRGLSMALTGLVPMVLTLLFGVVALALPLVFSPARAAYALAALAGGLVYQAGLWSARRRGILDAETHY